MRAPLVDIQHGDLAGVQRRVVGRDVQRLDEQENSESNPRYQDGLHLAIVRGLLRLSGRE